MSERSTGGDLDEPKMAFPWAAGWSGPADEPTFRWRPRGATAVADTTATWTVGYRLREVRTRAADGVGLAVAGSCLARADELDRAVAAARARRWAELAAWPGSYVTIVQRRGETVIFGDLAGAVRVYFSRVGGGCLWSTAATPLAAYTGGRRRMDVVALNLAVTGIELYGGEVPYDGIEAVPPGWLLRIADGIPSVERWYGPGAFGETPNEFPEVASAFREILVDGVERRAACGSVPLSGDFSGGVDSSTLLCLAARDTEVAGITYADYPGAADSAERIAGHCPKLRHEVIGQRPQSLHYAGLGSGGGLPVTDLPSGDLAVIGPDRDILEVAASLGSTDHLIGVGGDELLARRETALVTLMRSGRRAEAVRKAIELSREDRVSATRMVAAVARLSRTTHARALREMARRVRSGGISPTVEAERSQYVAWSTPLCAAAWLTPAMAEWAGQRLTELAGEGSDYALPEMLADWQQGVRLGASDIAGYRALAHGQGITVHTPYYDNRMIGVCLAVPGHIREPWSFKPMVTTGMADLLPPPLAGMRQKENNNVLVADQQGLAANAGALRELVASSVLIGAGIFKGGAVSDYVERAIAGVDTRHRSLIGFIAAELWARRGDPVRSAWWEEN